MQQQNDDLKKQNDDLHKKVTTLEAQHISIIEGQITLRKDILEKISTSTTENSGVSGTLYEPIQGFPLTTVQEFNDMETDSRADERKRFVSF